MVGVVQLFLASILVFLAASLPACSTATISSSGDVATSNDTKWREGIFLVTNKAVYNLQELIEVSLINHKQGHVKVRVLSYDCEMLPFVISHLENGSDWYDYPILPASCDTCYGTDYFTILLQNSSKKYSWDQKVYPQNDMCELRYVEPGTYRVTIQGHYDLDGELLISEPFVITSD